MNKIRFAILITLLVSVFLFAEVRYDSKGNMIEDASGNFYTYDAKNNLLTKTNTLGEVECWTYDKDNKKLTYTDSDGNVTEY